MEKENEIIIKECVDMLEKIHSSINYLNSGIKDNNKDVIKQCNKIDDIIEYLNSLAKQDKEIQIYYFEDWLKWLNENQIPINIKHMNFKEYYQNLETFENNYIEFLESIK